MGLPAFVLFQVLRNFSEGLSHTMPTMVIGFVGLAVNIPANYIFIHGHFGMPKLGGVGCGVATAIVLWAMLLAMIAYVKLSPPTSRRSTCSPSWHAPTAAGSGACFA